jgi:hypothetical protein
LDEQWHEQLADGPGPATLLASQLLQRLGFLGVSRLRQPDKRLVQIANGLVDRRLVNAVELFELLEQVFPIDALGVENGSELNGTNPRRKSLGNRQLRW